MSEPTFDWLSSPDDDGNETYVSITGITEHAPGRVVWEIAGEIAGTPDDVVLDDDAASAWSTVAYIMTEHGATDEETGEMVQHAPEHLGWCFDGQVGMYAYDKNEEWDG